MHLLFAAGSWVVLPTARVWCASLAWSITQGHRHWSPWSFWASPPKLPVLVLFIAACFLLALQPEILSTHFGEQRALGISSAGDTSLCISSWDVSQVLSVLKCRHSSGTALGHRQGVHGLCVGMDGWRGGEGCRCMVCPVKQARDSLSFPLEIQISLHGFKCRILH